MMRCLLRLRGWVFELMFEAETDSANSAGTALAGWHVMPGNGIAPITYNLA